LILLTLLSGCGGGFRYVGTWEGTRNRTFPPGTDPAVATTLARVKLTVRDNGRFVFVDGGIPKEGSFDYATDVAHLKVAAVVGRRVPSATRDILVTPQEDGSIRVEDPEALDPSPVTLRRVTQPGG